MKIKKYPQSHLIIIGDTGNKLIIDPGYLTAKFGFKVEEFQGADAYLITHQHPDHLDPETIKEVVEDKPVYCNFNVAEKLKPLGVKATVVSNKKQFSVAGFNIIPIDLPHFWIPDTPKPPQNTGFVIDGIFFHAGDGFKLEGLEVKNAALPIGHPAISTVDVLEFAKSLKVKLIIPIHYDAYSRDPNELKKIAEPFGIEVRPLSQGEETTI